MDKDVLLLFHELADLSPRERERVLRERPIGLELRSEVESLLGFDSPSDSSLTGGVAGAAEDLLNSRFAHPLNCHCGPYRLVRLLGRGGMGSVYLAERNDGEVEQRVAIKYIQANGAGGASSAAASFASVRSLPSSNTPASPVCLTPVTQVTANRT